MIYIISGTNRPNSRTLQICNIAKKMFDELGENTDIVDLRELPLSELDGSQYSENKPQQLIDVNNKLLNATGFYIVCPEYNGSMPGILKYFIDHWKFPDTFEYRPVAFVGLGGRFGGMRPVEHLQQVFGYRNAFIYPERTFLANIWTALKDGALVEDKTVAHMKHQIQGFSTFVKAIHSAGLDANAFLAQKDNHPSL